MAEYDGFADDEYDFIDFESDSQYFRNLTVDKEELNEFPKAKRRKCGNKELGIQNEIKEPGQLSCNLNGISNRIMMSFEEKCDLNSRSIYLTNVDFRVTADELFQHFRGCGTINQVLILSKFVHIEFDNKRSVKIATELDASFIRGKQIRVRAKRINQREICIRKPIPKGVWGIGPIRRQRDSFSIRFKPY